MMITYILSIQCCNNYKSAIRKYIALRKVVITNLTTGMLRKNSKETVQHFIASDEVFVFINSVKGTPGCLKKILQEVFAMVKQLCLPTFFLT